MMPRNLSKLSELLRARTALKGRFRALTSTLPIKLNENVVKKLRERLQHILPRASKQSVEDILKSVLQPDPPPFDSLAARLLNEKCTPNEIHLALICCRNALLVLQARSFESLGLKDLSSHLAHYDRMISFLMRAIEKRDEQEWRSLQAELLNEGHAHLLSRAINRWAKEREITLYNYYKEMPVSVPVKLLQIGESGFTVEKNKKLAALISASEDSKSVYTRMPNSELSICLTVEAVTRKTVRWHYGEFSQLLREKRRGIRVQSNTPFHIKLKSSEKRRWDGYVRDISTNGLGISCTCDMPFQVGDMLAFSILLQGHSLVGKGAICWVSGSKGHYLAGLAIEYDQETYLRLGNEVGRIQKNLMGELRMKGIPYCLTPG